MAKFCIHLEVDVELNGETPEHVKEVMKRRLGEHITQTSLTGFSEAIAKTYKMDVRHLLPKPRIITLAQLEQMPLGTQVSQVIMTEGGRADFDIQGTLQLKPEARMTSRDSWQLNFTPVRPDVHVDEGRVSTQKGEFSFLYPNENYPHRFVIWEECPWPDPSATSSTPTAASVASN